MKPVCQVTRSRIAAWLARLASLLFFLSSLGYFLHTSNDPVLLGKYSSQYVLFLAAQFFVMVPAFHFLARFCAARHELTLRSGRTLVFRPRHKLALVFAVGALLYFSVIAYTDYLVRTRTMTYSGDRFHPYLQNTPIPNAAHLHINRWGFRGDDFDQQKGPDTFRIFMFGGSTVFCSTVPFEESHCRLLEKRLREAYPRVHVEVQNLGVDWHTTEHDTIKLLFYAQDFSPDLVVTFHGINDLVRSLTPDMFGDGQYRSDYRHYLGPAANLVTGGRKVPWSVLTGYWCSDLLFDQIRITGPDGDGLGGVRTSFVPKARPVEITAWPSLAAFERNLRDFVEIARLKNMQVLLATQPSLYREDLTEADRQLLVFPLSHYFNGQRPSLYSMIDGMGIFNGATRQMAAELRVDLVDLERRMPKTTDYLYDDVHYTRTGNELVANAFAEQIIDSQVIDHVLRKRAERGELESRRTFDERR